MKKPEEATTPEAPALGRRDFMRQLAALAAAAEVGLLSREGLAAAQAVGAAPAAGESPAAAASPTLPPDFKPAGTFNGIQMGPHTMLDEGIERTLDLIGETAGINAVLPYSHGYNNAFIKQLRDRADHGVPLTDNRGRRFPMVWVKTHEQYYKDTTLRHQVVDESYEHAKRDLFQEMTEPAHQRGMKVFARVLEAGGRSIANFSKVVTRDVNGRATGTACWNHPEYIAFWADTMDDLFRTYDLDGIQWGAERQGPLMNVILPWQNSGAPISPTCFCEFCVARGKAAGIDPERARTGFSRLFDYVLGLREGTSDTADGVFAGGLRIIIRYPEILAWEYQYRLGRENIQKAMYDRVKSIRPAAEVGWHVDHQPSSWDIVYRAEMSYAEMAPHADFIKPILYHSVLAPRIRGWYLPAAQRSLLGELSLDESLNLYYDLFGYDKNAEPKLNELNRKGFSAEYVYRETKHCVASAAGKTKIYSGVGIDVPGSPPDDPAVVEAAVLKAFEAGAHGIVVSREYEEMKVENLRAIGRAYRAVAKRSA